MSTVIVKSTIDIIEGVADVIYSHSRGRINPYYTVEFRKYIMDRMIFKDEIYHSYINLLCEYDEISDLYEGMRVDMLRWIIKTVLSKALCSDVVTVILEYYYDPIKRADTALTVFYRYIENGKRRNREFNELMSGYSDEDEYERRLIADEEMDRHGFSKYEDQNDYSSYIYYV
jgi:hypothetical protein